MTSNVRQEDFHVAVFRSDINDLEPNTRGLYTLCFHSSCRQPPLYNENEIRNLFSPVAPIAYLTHYKGLQFVHFNNKDLAIKAWMAFRVKLNISMADQRKDVLPAKVFKPEKPNSTEIKKTKTNKKSPDHSRGTGKTKILTANGININNNNDNNNKKKSKRTLSYSNYNQDYDYLKARMPPLENIVSDDDDDDDGEETDFGTTFNENIRPTDMTNSFHLFVGNFPYDTSEVNLMKLFQPYYPIEVRILNTNDRSRSTQGFVCFANARDLDKATEEMDLAEYKNHILLVTSSICCGNIPKDEHLQCTITPVPGESQYQRKVMLDTKNERCRTWLKTSLQLGQDSVGSNHK